MSSSKSQQIPSSSEALWGLVREAYGEVARTGGARGAPDCACSGGGEGAARRAQLHGLAIGYAPDVLDKVPEGANLGLGCGNPTAIAELAPGEVVLDLGAGAGLDAFIAARIVGESGRVIGVDMTPEMLAAARAHAFEMGVHGFVEFREGHIEELPVASSSVDAVISNCVINLSPDKPAVFREAFRVLKPGGRLAVSDIVLSEPFPEPLRRLARAYVACLAGAATEDELRRWMIATGFVDIDMERSPVGALLLDSLDDPMVGAAQELLGRQRLSEIAETVWSTRIRARKPLKPSSTTSSP